MFPAAEHLTSQYLDWHYNRNPAGPAIGLNAFHGGVLVGHCGAVSLRARLFGSEAMGALLVNLAVRREHRGRGLMAELGRGTLDPSRSAGYEFLIGVANDASTRAICIPLGFQLVQPLEARVGIGPIPRGRTGSGADFERLWDPQTMAWRLSNPKQRYLINARDGRLEVYAPTGRWGTLAMLGSLDAPLALKEAAPVPLRVQIWIGADASIDWSRSFYWNLPRRLRPVPLNFMFLDLTPQSRRIEPSRLRFTGLDFDAY